MGSQQSLVDHVIGHATGTTLAVVAVSLWPTSRAIFSIGTPASDIRETKLWRSSRVIHSSASRARLRRARPSGLGRFGRGNARASIERANWRGNRVSSRGRAAGAAPTSGRAACRALPGGSPRGAAPPPGQQARTCRQTVPGGNAADAPRPRGLARPSSSRQAFSRRAKITV